MAERQHFRVPVTFQAKLRPWVEDSAKREDWGNAREMRTLLEKAREAQALRLSTDPNGDLSVLELPDLEQAMGAIR